MPSDSTPHQASCSWRITRLVSLSSTTRARRPVEEAAGALVVGGAGGDTRAVVGGGVQQGGEGEDAAAAGVGEVADLAAERLDDLARDGQAESGAAVDPGGGGVGLGERVEEVGVVLVGDADAGVAHLHAQLHAVAGRHGGGAHDDAAVTR